MAANAQVDSRGYKVSVGARAPDFEAKLTDGTSIRLSGFLGKVVMLQFTASWCSVCRAEMPVIEKEIWSINKNGDLVVIGIDREEPLETVVDFAKKTGVTYPLALDPGANIFGLYADKKAGVTRNVIIDKEGKIAFMTRLFERAEFDEMKKVIGKLLVD